MDICTEKIIENYLLYKNPLFAFRFPLSLLLGIFMYGYFEMKKISSNSYIQQILIPLASILFSMVLIDMICRLMISKDEVDRLMKLCKLFFAQPKMKGREVDIMVIENYGGEVEGFQVKGTSQESKMPEITEMPNKKDSTKIIPDTSTTGKMKTNKMNTKLPKEINITFEGFTTNQQMEQVGEPNSYDLAFDNFENMNEVPEKVETKRMIGPSKCIQPSDCCNLCSGSNENPCNVVTAIPGPQWMPQTAKAKQNELQNNQYTPSTCPIY